MTGSRRVCAKNNEKHIYICVNLYNELSNLTAYMHDLYGAMQKFQA